MAGEEVVDCFLFDMAIENIDIQITALLRKKEFYRKWQEEMEEIIEKYSCITEVLEGESVLSLTEEEHKAFRHYMNLQKKMEAKQKREYYRFGHVHAAMYQKELTERMDCKIRSGQNMGKGQYDLMQKIMWNHEKTSYRLELLHEYLETVREKRLKENPGYQKLNEEEHRLIEQSPLLWLIIEGGEPSGDIQLTMEQQKEVAEFISIWLNKEVYQEIEDYLTGFKDGIEYFYTMSG